MSFLDADERLESRSPQRSQGSADFPRQLNRSQRSVVLLAAAASSACGLATELLLGGLTSYLVGDHALAYGVAVGGFLAAMGVGSYLSQFVAIAPDENFGKNSNKSSHRRNAEEKQSASQEFVQTIIRAFLRVELAMAPAIALMPLGLFTLFVAGGWLWLGLGLSTLFLGILAGMEVPLLTRLLERDSSVKDALAGVLALDYAGALVGAIAFPLILLPWLGMFPAAACLGAIPAIMVVAIARAFRPLVPGARDWGRLGLLIAMGLLVLAPLTVPLGNTLENRLYKAAVIYRETSQYQRIVLTQNEGDTRLFLDGDLQFSTADEYRYHEALTYPVLGAVRSPKRVLLLGAGDGLALREILRWPGVEAITVLELDPAVVELGRSHPTLVRANRRSFDDPRVSVEFGDAFQLVRDLPNTFDVVIADFPDPDRDALAKLYSDGFYRMLRSHLAPEGAMVTQASSPYFAPKAFACVAETLAATGFKTYPYRVDIPSFGPWGFVLATNQAIALNQIEIPIESKFLTPELLPALFALPKDEQWEPGSIQVNRLSHPVLPQYQRDRRWQGY
ncbi:MAG: polyamine aminopropyltransferase [Cyanobacteria bacterium P01_D01_bin.73]